LYALTFFLSGAYSKVKEVKVMNEGFVVDYQALGAKIKSRRQALGLTQERVSEKLDLSESFYSRVERGERVISVETLIKIANYFNLSLDYLLLDSIRVSASEKVQTELDLIFSGMDPQQSSYLLELLKVHAENIDRLRG